MKKSAIFMTILCTGSLIAACTHKTESGDAGHPTDSVSTQVAEISLSYKLPTDTGKRCDVQVKLVYPTAYASDSATTRINSLLAAQLLGPEYSHYTSLQAAADSMATHRLDEIKTGLLALCNENLISADVAFMSATQIAPVYNKHGFLSYNAYSYSYEGGAHGISNSSYCTIYLPGMYCLSLADVVAPEYDTDINRMLVDALLKQLDLTNSEELVNVGYFDPEGITATDNFFLGDKGVTWEYNPYEIGCYAIGSTRISLSYEDLFYYMPEDSPLRQFVNDNAQ